MVDHISLTQVQAWLDDRVVHEAKHTSGDDTEYEIQLQLSRLPLNIIKEDTWGPIRIVGKDSFDTAQSKAILENPQSRQELLTRIGPVLAATSGFYTFLDNENRTTELAGMHSIQLEHRLYPNELTQQALMSSLMDIATAMRYIQNAVAAMQDSLDE